MIIPNLNFTIKLSQNLLPCLIPPTVEQLSDIYPNI